MTVTSMRDGATADSKTPSSTLVVTRPAQFFAADVQTTMIPHCAESLVNSSVVYTQISDDSGASSIGLAYKDNHRSKILRGWKGLHAVCMRKLASQVANVEYHGQLAELIACKMRSVSKLHVSNVILT